MTISYWRHVDIHECVSLDRFLFFLEAWRALEDVKEFYFHGEVWKEVVGAQGIAQVSQPPEGSSRVWGLPKGIGCLGKGIASW